MSVIKANGAGSAASDFYSYKIDQSLKFDENESSYLSRTPASAGNRRTWTWSCWLKLSKIDHWTTLFSSGADSNNKTRLKLDDSKGRLFFDDESSGSSTQRFYTNQFFRDPSAWYNIVLKVDSTQSTDTNRVKIYVNGTQVTSFYQATYPSQNLEYNVNTTNTFEIGKQVGGSDYKDGYLAEIVFIDGTAYDASNFGETKDGVWVPKDASGLTFGTNGFYLPFKSDAVSEGFNVVTYLGNDTSQTIGGIGFAPDFVWLKNRDVAEVHSLYDTVRGATAQLFSSETDAEADRGVYGLTAFTGDGFTVGSGGEVNDANEKYVAWCWEAGGAPTADNSASAGATPTAGSVKIDGSNLGSALGGSIAATRLTANTSKGFSVVSYTGNGTSGATVAHGLSAAPDWILVKVRSGSSGNTNWRVYHSAINEEHHLVLNNKAGKTGQTNIWNDTAPTSTVFSLGNHVSVNENNSTTIAYCWHDVSGYSKFGSYTGDGSSSNAVTGLGFKPAWLMVKRVDTETTYSNWWIQDSTRSPSNAVSKAQLAADTNATETTALEVDFDSDGFTLKDASQGSNISGGTYIYMAFADTREAAFFKDASGQGHNFTPTNLDYRNVLLDSPTNNFCTLNQIDNISTTYSEGSLKYAQSNYDYNSRGTMAVTSGKWYWEIRMSGTHGEFGVCENGKAGQSDPQANIGFNFIYNNGSAGISWKNATAGAQATTGISMTNWSANDICQIAYDADNGILYHGLNGTYQTSGDPAAGSGGLITGIAPQFGGTMVPFFGSGTSSARTWVVNFGQDGTFAGTKTAQGNADGNGIGDFFYAPPSGYLALCTANLPDPTIGPTASTLATDNFNTVLFTGNGSTQSVTGLDFQPDWTWIKMRSDSGRGHALFDSVRGGDERLAAEGTQEGRTNEGNITFESDGFNVTSSHPTVNDNSDTAVAWNWKAGGSASSNSDGSITSSVSANTAAGFSIVGFEGSGSAATVGHGLSAAPEMLIVKNRENASGLWLVYHAAIASDAETDYIHLESTNAAADDNSAWNDTAPTSSVFSVGTSVASNGSGKDMIAYCFHSVEGYSKLGGYTGNGNANGTFIFTGFRPAWIMVKRESGGSGTANWVILDTERDIHNLSGIALMPNLSRDEYTPASSGYPMDILSNGFKQRGASVSQNESGSTYIYMAFAESPFKFANAR